MPDRSFNFVIAFDGDASTFKSVLNTLKSDTRSAVTDIEGQLRKVDLFKKIETDVVASSAALQTARANVDKLSASIAQAKAQGSPTGELEKGLVAAQREVTATTKELDRQTAALAKLSGQLAKAGVDTKNLAAEEQRLATAHKAAAQAAAEQDAKQALGLKTLKDVQPEVARLRSSYETLRVSGTLSANEVAAAQRLLRDRIREVEGSVTSTTRSALAGTPVLSGFFQTPLAKALALAGGVTGIVASLHSAIAAAQDFANEVARIGTVTNLSKADLKGLGDGVREVAQELGIGLQDALRATFELIRSGVSPDNAIEVLRVSAEAAKASLTDVGTGAKAANLLLDAFGASVGELPELFDKIIVGARNGGATLAEFANSAGGLLNVARAAGIGFDDLLATLTVLVDKSGNAEKSIGDLTKIIARIDTTETRAKLRALGIEFSSLSDLFRQIGERGLPLSQVLGLDIASGGAKAAASIAALTNNASELPEKLDAISKAGGEAARVIKGLYDTPKERADRFNAALEETKVKLGEAAGASSRLLVPLTKLLRTFNAIPDEIRETAIASGSYTELLSGLVLTQLGVFDSSKKVSEGLKDQALAEKLAAEEAKQFSVAMKKAQADLTDFSTQLAADVQALQQAASRDLADAQARADAQVAALDRTRVASAATAQATLDIQLKLAADKFAIIDKSERDVTAAVAAQTAARERIQRQSGETERKIAADSAAARIAAIGPVLQQYQALYNQLIGLAQSERLKVQELNDARISITQKTSDAIREIRLSELSGLDQYVARIKEADRLVSEGRKAALLGDIAQAQKFFDQAIAESDKLKEVVSANGAIVVSSFDAQQKKLEILKSVQTAANETIGDQADAAKKGADAAIAQADLVKAKIEELQRTYDDLKQSVADGLNVKIEVDEQSVADALRTLDDLTRPRTVRITVETVTSGGAPVPLDGAGGGGGGGGAEPAPAGFAKGGPVGAPALTKRSPISEHPLTFADGGAVPPMQQAMQYPLLNSPPISSAFRSAASSTHRFSDWRRFAVGGSVSHKNMRSSHTTSSTQRVAFDWRFPRFAAGGSVFAAPTWNKVPGYEHGDVVPAALEAGSFVVRKAASVKHGDRVMGALARGLAVGGAVIPPEVAERGVARSGPGPAQIFLRPSFTFSPLARFALGGAAVKHPGQFNALRSSASSALYANWPTTVIRRELGGAVTAPVRMTLGGNLIAQRTFASIPGALLGRSIQQGLTLSAPAGRDTYKETRDRLQKLVEVTNGSGIPPSPRGLLSFVNWASTILQQFDTYSPAHQAAIKTVIDDSFDAWVAGTQNAARLHLPLTIDPKLAVLAQPYAVGGPVSRFAFTFASAKADTPPSRFAEGGAPFAAPSRGGDVVPAMLTPGEWVISRPAVESISRTFGASFLPELNAMRVAPGALDRLIAPAAPVAPRYYAEGGRVSYASTSFGDSSDASIAQRSSAGGSKTPQGPTTINIYGNNIDRDFVRREIVPHLEDLERRSSGRSNG